MQTQLCSDVKQLVAEYLNDNLRGSSRESGGCTITLPLKTVDDRWIFVIVESRFDYFLVHDGGKTDSSLFSQGVKMSDADEQFNAAIASRYGVMIEKGRIQKNCQRNQLCETILAVGQSAIAMTAQLVSPRLVEAEAQEVHVRVSEALRLWKPEDMVIEQNVEIEGMLSTHTLNFITRPKGKAHKTAAIKILPASNPRGRAERYGFMHYDILLNSEHPERKNWVNLAVILGVETWSEPALRIVKGLADTTLEVTTEKQTELEGRIPKMLSALTAGQLTELKQ